MAKLKEIAQELCESYSSCALCPMRAASTQKSCIVRSMSLAPADAEDIISELYHWYESRPAPERTRVSVFLESFPNAETVFYDDVSTGKRYKIPRVCARHIYSNVKCNGNGCVSCWQQPLVES